MFNLKKYSPTAATALSTKENIGNDLGRIPSKDSGIRAVARFLTVTAFIIAGCSENNNSVANGTGSEAGETELASISVTMPNGAPLARGIARQWNMNEKGMEVLHTDTLDEKGIIRIENSSSGIFLLEVRLGDTLSAMRWLPNNNHKSQTIPTDSSVSLRGTIANEGRFVKDAKVSVLDKVAYTDGKGVFEIGNLPAGVHYAFVEGDFGKFAYQMQTGTDEIPVTNNIDLSDSVFTVIEDFENWKSRRTLIGKSFGQGWWFICTDSLQGGGSRVSGGIGDNNILVSGDSAKDGSSLHLVFEIDEETEGHYGVAGFAIGDDFDEKDMPSFYDLSATKAISFDAKGEGKMYLQITKRSAEGEREFHETKALELTDEWQHFTITADDFETELVAVNSLNFMVNEDAEIYLDNIRLDGISPSTWPSLGMEF